MRVLLGFLLGTAICAGQTTTTAALVVPIHTTVSVTTDLSPYLVSGGAGDNTVLTTAAFPAFPANVNIHIEHVSAICSAMPNALTLSMSIEVTGLPDSSTANHVFTAVHPLLLQETASPDFTAGGASFKNLKTAFSSQPISLYLNQNAAPATPEVHLHWSLPAAGAGTFTYTTSSSLSIGCNVSFSGYYTSATSTSSVLRRN